MSEYKGLQYKTRGNTTPNGKSKVFFCCHEKDFKRYFEPVTQEILGIQNNAAIWYYDPSAGIPDGEGFLNDLLEMQLFVIPVTGKFIYKNNHARTVEYAYALEHHIPVLPLMQESGLENDFNHICGNIQFLDKSASETDPTVLPYEDKLKQFLKHTLISDEWTQMIREYFLAYIFLSYRKKDRKYAQEIMRRIHTNRICRDVAIWYDEFLTPGENFNEEIEAAMKKSSLFAFVVTPSLLEKPNYVMTVEYPAALKTGKPILPIEGIPTDYTKLSRLYEGIPKPVTAEELPDKLREMLKDIPLLEEDNLPINNFFMGLAYLSGIDVEVNVERALELLTSSADHGIQMAYEQLVFMYRNGMGVERNDDMAIMWQKKYVRLFEKDERNPGKDRTRIPLIRHTLELGDYQSESGDIREAEKTYRKMIDETKKLDEQSDERRKYTSIAFNRLGLICDAKGTHSEAVSWYEKDVKMALKLAKKTKSKESYEHLAASYYNLGLSYKQTGDLSKAKKSQESALELKQKISTEYNTAEARHEVRKSITALGDICKAQGNIPEAKEYCRKALDIAVKLAEENDSAGYLRAVCLCYKNMADICDSEGNLTDAADWYRKALDPG